MVERTRLFEYLDQVSNPGFLRDVVALDDHGFVDWIETDLFGDGVDRFGSLLAAGLSALVVLQAAIVMAVTTGLAPTKGLPLPYVSYGGTALIVFLAMAGVLANIGAQAKDPAAGGKRQSA